MLFDNRIEQIDCSNPVALIIMRFSLEEKKKAPDFQAFFREYIFNHSEKNVLRYYLSSAVCMCMGV